MDVLPPLPVFPRPLKRAWPSSGSRYHFSTQPRTRSLTTPANQVDTHDTPRTRRLTAPRTPDLGGSGSPTLPSSRNRPPVGTTRVVELVAPLDEIDYLLSFLPAPLVPNLMEQLRRIDSSHRKLQELQDERIKQARWTRTMRELKAIKVRPRSGVPDRVAEG
jgi:hypothetical protein